MSLLLLFNVPSALADDLTRQVQEQLQSLNFYSGPIDGEGTDEFVTALKAFQVKHRLAATGKVDMDTAKALDEETGTMQGSESHPSPGPSEPAARSVVVESSSTPQSTPVATVTAAESPTAPPSAAGASSSTTPAHAAANPDVAANTPSPPSRPALSSAPEELPETLPASSPSGLTSDRVQAFVAEYLEAGAGNDVAAQVRYFAFPIDYFGHGRVNENFVRKDTAGYVSRWPTRHYMLTGPVKIMLESADTATAEFTIAFSVERKGQAASGRTSIRMRVRDSSGALKIIGITEKRLSSESRWP